MAKSKNRKPSAAAIAIAESVKLAGGKTPTRKQIMAMALKIDEREGERLANAPNGAPQDSTPIDPLAALAPACVLCHKRHTHGTC